MLWRGVRVAAPQPLPTHPCHGVSMPRAGSCPTAPTLLHQQHGVRGAVGIQGGLLCCRHPLLKCRRGEAVVLAGVWVRLEQSVLVGGIPCREVSGGKGLVPPTHSLTHPAPCEHRSHLQVPRMVPGGQGHGGRCRTAAAPTAAPPGPPVLGAERSWGCLGHSGWEVSQSQNQPWLSLPGCPLLLPPPKKTLGDQCLPWEAISGATFWGASSSCKGKRDGILPLCMGAASLPLPRISAGCWAPAWEHPQGHGGAMPEQRQWGHPPSPPHYLWLLVQRLLILCRVRAAEISLLAMPEGTWKESGMSRAP